MNPQQFLLKLTENLTILRQREARYGGDAPLSLLNQIEDHRQAIALTEEVIAGTLSPEAWRAQLRPLLLPFWQELGRTVLDVLLQAAQTPTEAPAPVSRLSDAALDGLRRTPPGQMVAQEFTQDPQTWGKPARKHLTETLQTDPDLAVQLHRLLARVEAAVANPGAGYQAKLGGSEANAPPKSRLGHHLTTIQTTCPAQEALSGRSFSHTRFLRATRSSWRKY